MMDWNNPNPQHIQIGTTKLEAQCFGPPPSNAPTIIMLHEGLGCIALWRDFPSRLAEATGYGVLAYSRAGYGGSDGSPPPKPLDYMTREAMDVLPLVLDQIGFQRGILLGHSDGASIVTIYAGSTEDMRIRGLVLMAPHFFTEPVGLTAIKAAKEIYETGDLKQKLAKYHTHVDDAFYGWNGAWLDDDFKDWNIAENIDYLRIPVLGIQGRNDEYGTLAQLDELEARLYSPFDCAILEDCKHSPHLEKADETLGVITEFCQRLERLERELVSTSNAAPSQ
ncbi:MAG: alpha/beta hydrolase [Hyphomicrobiales bacterium]